MATVTISSVDKVGAIHAGVNALVCQVSLSVSWSSGDVHVIGRLPHGAIPLDSVFYPGAAISGVTVAKFGTSASQELFLASDTYSVAVARQITTLANQQISLSDDAMPRYQNVVMVATAGASIGHIGTLVVYYKMPPA